MSNFQPNSDLYLSLKKKYKSATFSKDNISITFYGPSPQTFIIALIIDDEDYYKKDNVLYPVDNFNIENMALSRMDNEDPIPINGMEGINSLICALVVFNRISVIDYIKKTLENSPLLGIDKSMSIYYYENYKSKNRLDINNDDKKALNEILLMCYIYPNSNENFDRNVNELINAETNDGDIKQLKDKINEEYLTGMKKDKVYFEKAYNYTYSNSLKEILKILCPSINCFSSCSQNSTENYIEDKDKYEDDDSDNSSYSFSGIMNED